MPDYIFDIVFFEVFDEEENAIKKYLPDNVKAKFYKGTIQEENPPHPDAKVISIRTQSIVPSAWIEDLSALLSRSTGYDHIAYLKDEIQLGYLPTYCSRSVAEHAMLMWTCLLKKLPQQLDNFKTFNRDGITGSELKNKNILVVGVGNIGIEIVRIARSLNMNVHGLDIVHKHDDVDYVSAEDDLSQYDIIVCAMNLTEININYFNDDFFQRVKKACIFINISRGEISPTAVLDNYLENGTLAGIGLDVFDEEKKLATALRENKTSLDDDVRLILKLNQQANVILTPHNAFNTEESTERKSQQSVEQLEYFIKHGKFKWNVD
jgi:D-lactate dehydrogenase